MEVILNYMLILIVGVCGWIYAIAAFVLICTAIDKVANYILKIIMSVISKFKRYRKTQEIK